MIAHVYRRRSGGVVVYFMRSGVTVSSIPAPDLESIHTKLYDAGYARRAVASKLVEGVLETWGRLCYQACRPCALDAKRRRTHCQRHPCASP